MTDPIVAEIRATRERIAEESGCDIHAIAEAARKRQQVSGVRTVSQPRRLPDTNLVKTCVCGSWVGPKRNRHILACSGLVQLKWPAAGVLVRLLRPSCTFRTLQKHWENTQKFGSCPLRSKTLVFPGFSHFGEVPLAVCSAHATRCMAPAALHFASRTENRVVFRVARVVKTLGFCMSRFRPDPRR